MRTSLAPFVAAVPLLAACIATGDDRLGHRSTSWNRERTVVSVDELPVQVSDVAILPVVDTSGAPAPRGPLRDALARELPSRLYSPLALDWVDGRWAEASSSLQPSAVPPGLEADALLELTVLAWETQAGRTRVDAVARLLDGQRGETVLWELEIAREVSTPVGMGAELRSDRVAEALARAVVAEMPDRDPVGEDVASPADGGEHSAQAEGADD